MGELDIEGLITRRIKSDELNDAVAALARGEVIRQVVNLRLNQGARLVPRRSG